MGMPLNVLVNFASCCSIVLVISLICSILRFVDHAKMYTVHKAVKKYLHQMVEGKTLYIDALLDEAQQT